MNLSQRKLTAQDVIKVRSWGEAHAIARKVPPARVMAKRLKVSRGTLYAIIRGERYKEVDRG